MKNSPEFKEKLKELDSDSLWDIMNNEFNRHVFADFASMYDGTPEFNEWAYDKITSEVSEDELDEGGWVLDEGSYWDILCEYFNEDSVFADFALVMQGTPEFDEWAINQIFDFVSEEDLMENGWIEDDRTDRLYEKLDKVNGEFYTIGRNELNTDYKEEYMPYDTLGDAISDAMSGLVDGKYWIVVDENGSLLFDIDSVTTRELGAFRGFIYEEQYRIIENALTDEAKYLMK